MDAFNQSLKYDQRMYAADILGSIAYAKALALVGILTKDEESKMIQGLTAVGKEWQSGQACLSRSSPRSPDRSSSKQFQVQADDEDIHTANERRLSELIGPLGGKLHTGRSRNDQVATDMRLWLLEQVSEVEASLVALIRVMVERADKERDHLMPGYTHLQVSFPFTYLAPARIPNRLYRRSSAANPFVGPTSSCPMPSPSVRISSASVSSSREYPFCPSAPGHLRATPLPLIVTSSRKSSDSSPSRRTACGVWATATLS